MFDYWQAQDALREWSGQQTLIDEGLVRAGPYTVADAVRDYLEEARVEKNAASFRASEITFNALVLPELGDVQVAKLTTDRLIRWRNANATRPRRLFANAPEKVGRGLRQEGRALDANQN